MNDTKKEVCRTLTNVVRKSPLVDRIDPKSFFVMLNTNFGVLYRGDTMDLVPVWDALAGDEAPPPLYGLFLAFERAAFDKGFSVALPAAVRELSAEQRESFSALLDGANGAVPPSIVEVTDDTFFETDPNAQAIPLSLGTGDLKPFVPDDLKRDVIQMVVQSLKTAPVGQKLDTAQLAYLVDSNFDDLCDGTTFDFGPILGGLRQLDGVQDSDVYAGVVALEQALVERDISLLPIHMDVDRELAARLVAEAEQAARDKAEEAALESRAKAQSAQEPAAPPPPTPSTPLEVPKGAEAREERLKRWGLRMLTKRQQKVLRYGILVVGLLSVLTLGWLYRLDRVIDPETFTPNFPMKSAEIRDGVFFGVVDDAKWWPIAVDQRKQRLDTLQNIMRDNGWMPGAQIRDSQQRLVITGMGGRKLAVARFFELGTKDGGVPDSAKVIPADAPPEVRAAAAKQALEKRKKENIEANEKKE